MWLEAFLSRVILSISLKNLLCVASLYCVLCYSIFLFDKDTIWYLGTEDGVIEYLGALFFFITSILCFVLFRRSDKVNTSFPIIKANSNVFYLIIGIMFLFAAGEEISWGQRIFDIPVPDGYKALNVQKELSIHNLNIFQKSMSDGSIMNQLFVAFSLGYCFFIPFLNKFFSVFRRFRERIAIPLVPMSIGTFFLVTYLVYKVFKWYILDPKFGWPLSEIKESVWAFLFLVIAIHWMVDRKALVTIDSK